MKSLIKKILKEQSDSNEHYLLMTALEKFVSKLSYPEVCKIVVDWELDENNDIWVNTIISKDWFDYDPTINKVARVNRIRSDIRNKIESAFGFTIRAGSYVKECN